MKQILTLIAAFLALTAFTRYELPCKRELAERSLETAISQEGVTEVGFNNGNEVRAYLASVGLPAGNPYCAAGQYWAFVIACNELGLSISEIPLCRTGSSQLMFTDAMKHGKKTKAKPQIGDLPVWRVGHTNSGHVERIIALGKGGWFTTIAFNTSPDNSNPRNGDGVYIKKRNPNHILGRLSFRGFIGIKEI